MEKYNSQYDSIIDHAEILQLDRYKNLYQNATSVSDYAQALQDGGYAGNSTTYANKLMNHINTYNLNQYNLNNSTHKESYTGVGLQDIDSDSTDLNIIGTIIKYLAILLFSVIAIFFILKALGIEVL